MRRTAAARVDSATALRTRERANIRVVLLVLVVFLLGLAAGAFWHHRAARRPALEPGGLQSGALSDRTRAVLERLESPVEIRFYALLDPASVPDSVQAFAGRVDRVLSQYQQAARGRINVTRELTLSDSGAGAAAADGIQSFNRDKGEACYLGIAVACDRQKEVLPQLAPEWEPALESDLTRAIVRVTEAGPAAKPSLATAEPDAAVTEEVKRAIPNLASVSLEEGKRTLRTAALEEYMAAVVEMEKEINEAQQRLRNAEAAKSEPDRQAASEQLRQAQAKHAEKLSQIAARSQARIEALQRMKQP